MHVSDDADGTAYGPVDTVVVVVAVVVTVVVVVSVEVIVVVAVFVTVVLGVDVVVETLMEVTVVVTGGEYTSVSMVGPVTVPELGAVDHVFGPLVSVAGTLHAAPLSSQ